MSIIQSQITGVSTWVDNVERNLEEKIANSDIVNVISLEEHFGEIIDGKVTERIMSGNVSPIPSSELNDTRKGMDDLWKEIKLIQDKVEKRVSSSNVVLTSEAVTDLLWGANSALSRQFPKFKLDREVHQTKLLKRFNQALPKNWEDSKKIEFAVGYLLGEASEWGTVNIENFSSWEDFQKKFKENYWSASAQEKLISDPWDPGGVIYSLGTLHSELRAE
ncbi:uncharacterized protein LOC126161449 [Schistocerca cancellata]|uniref:uncharacterized protein LOC126161449 n=1 Tax=Schistocerca cancellata TaxID=274614 RepID=UPI00211876F9|nr:uncharacterized protein LOC126161449 [Schistocerca cancellata]XP_049773223.1 uncharacterized protein LOC126161449 [Schistocerca cancellata]